MAPSLSLAEFPPVYTAKGAFSPTRSQSLASNTTGSAQDILDTTTTDSSENEGWNNHAGEAAQHYEPFCPPPLLAPARRRRLPTKLDLDCDLCATEQSQSTSPCKRRGAHVAARQGPIEQSQSMSPCKGNRRNFCPSPGALQPLPSHIVAALDAAALALPQAQGPLLDLPVDDAKSQAQPLPSHIIAALDVAAAALPMRPPPGLEMPPGLEAAPCFEAPPVLVAPPGLEDFKLEAPPGVEAPPGIDLEGREAQLQEAPRVPPTRYQTPPRAQRPSAAILSVSPVSPNCMSPAGLVSVISTSPAGIVSTSPAAGMVPCWPSMRSPQRVGVPPCPPPSWPAPAGVPSCPPPSWPAPTSLEVSSPDRPGASQIARSIGQVSSPNAVWMDEDTSEAQPGVCKKPLKVYMEQVECEVLHLDPCVPVKKGVPQWF